MSACARVETDGPEPAPVAAPEPTPPPEPEPVVTPNAVVFPLIADTAARMTPAAAAGLKAAGVEVLFRYYSHVPPSIRGKHLEPPEAALILEAGLSLAAVFQHYNNCFLTFSGDWGREDAEKALEQARAVGQPSGTAIYFGVDGDFPFASMIGDVVRYFEAVNRAFEGSGYAIGAYGSGCALEQLRTRGLCQYFWLSGSTGFTGTQAFFNQGDWTLFQNHLDIAVANPRTGIDTNVLNPRANGFFGQWNAGGAASATLDSATSNAVFAGRRFLNRSASLRARPSADSEALAGLRIRSNVRLVGEAGEWSEVETQEGGVSRRGQSARGFIRTADLSSFERMPGSAGYGLCGADRRPPETLLSEGCTPKAVAFRAR